MNEPPSWTLCVQANVSGPQKKNVIIDEAHVAFKPFFIEGNKQAWKTDGCEFFSLEV